MWRMYAEGIESEKQDMTEIVDGGLRDFVNYISHSRQRSLSGGGPNKA